MRLLHLTTSYPRHAGDPSGGFVADSVQALVRRGHAVTVAAPHAPGTPMEETGRGGERIRRFRYGYAESLCYGEGIPENLRAAPWRAVQIPGLLWALYRATCRYAPEHDCVHAHWSVCGALAAAAASGNKRPLIVTLRGSDLNARLPLLSCLTRRAIRRAEALVTVSDSLRAAALRCGADAARVHVIPNGAPEIPPLAPAARLGVRHELGWMDDAPVFVMVGRLVPVKNPRLVLSAFSLATAAGMDARLVFAGDGSERKALQRMVRESGLASRVAFLGLVEPSGVYRLLQASDALVMGSLSEGRPNAVAEAMAAGLPVVATRVGGVPELVADGHTGVLVNSGDAAAMSDAMQAFATDGALRGRMGEAGRTRLAAVMPPWAVHAERLDAVYAACARR